MTSQENLHDYGVRGTLEPLFDPVLCKLYLDTKLKQAKDRLSLAAARCLAGDRAATSEADAALAEVKRIIEAIEEKAHE